MELSPHLCLFLALYSFELFANILETVCFWFGELVDHAILGTLEE